MEQKVQKRNQYSAAFKAKVALAAMSNTLTMSELASTYKIHPTQITKWKGQLQESAQDIFSDKRKKQQQDTEQLIEELYKQIGQSKVECDWLKKKSGLLTS